MNKEARLVKQFLESYKKLYEAKTKKKFHPRHLVMIFQENTKSDVFDWVAYYNWFNKLEYGTHIGSNLFDILLDNAIHVLISQEEKTMESKLSESNVKLVIKALKILRKVKFED